MGRLVTLLGDGTAGAIHTLAGGEADLGRHEGAIVIADPALAPRHARFVRHGTRVMLAPLDTVNGVYLAIRRGERQRLVAGDMILAGKEILRFETLDPGELDRAPALQHGIRLVGSPARMPWGRLCQLTLGSGRVRDAHPPCTAATWSSAAKKARVRFGDDDFMVAAARAPVTPGWWGGRDLRPRQPKRDVRAVAWGARAPAVGSRAGRRSAVPLRAGVNICYPGPLRIVLVYICEPRVGVNRYFCGLERIFFPFLCKGEGHSKG